MNIQAIYINLDIKKFAVNEEILKFHKHMQKSKVNATTGIQRK